MVGFRKLVMRVSELKMTVVLQGPVTKPAPGPLDFPVKIGKCSRDVSPFHLSQMAENTLPLAFRAGTSSCFASRSTSLFA